MTKRFFLFLLGAVSQQPDHFKPQYFCPPMLNGPVTFSAVLGAAFDHAQSYPWGTADSGAQTRVTNKPLFS